MPLKIELKPGERLIIGNALITNDNDRARIFIEGDVPILREKYVLTRNEATTPCKKVYYVIQEMYLSKEPKIFHEEYFARIKEIIAAAPRLTPHFDVINKNILENDYYSALKNAMILIGEEKSLLKIAEENTKKG
ncbi:MAG: flagellar biosynthesis repressor FlbT [Alphaproteobacteria bacterium ADurb.Bin438]|nr:MAG: flagellar biosynthesis repressor FlbT [Alphaproteobacteria bacterium ADurb.Bin438]